MLAATDRFLVDYVKAHVAALLNLAVEVGALRKKLFINRAHAAARVQ